MLAFARYDFVRDGSGNPFAHKDSEPWSPSVDDKLNPGLQTDSFEWGCMTYQSRALALMLLREFFRDEIAEWYADQFCRDWIARQPKRGFSVDAWEVVAYVAASMNKAAK
jgi:hypothetical protein